MLFFLFLLLVVSLNVIKIPKGSISIDLYTSKVSVTKRSTCTTVMQYSTTCICQPPESAVDHLN